MKSVVHSLEESKEVISTSKKAATDALITDSSGRSPEIVKVIDFVNSVIAKGKPYVDADFPPSKESLCTPDCKHEMRNYSWRRSSEIFDDPEVFKDGASYDDIEQG